MLVTMAIGFLLMVTPRFWGGFFKDRDWINCRSYGMSRLVNVRSRRCSGRFSCEIKTTPMSGLNKLGRTFGPQFLRAQIKV